MTIFFVSIGLLVLALGGLTYWFATAPRWDLWIYDFGHVKTVNELDALVPMITASADRNFSQHNPLNFDVTRQTVASHEPDLNKPELGYKGCIITAYAWVWRDSGMKPTEWKPTKVYTDLFRTHTYSKGDPAAISGSATNAPPTH